LIAMPGDASRVGPANFKVRNLQANGPPQDSFDNMAAAAGAVFLGTNIFCTSCHDGAGHTDAINLWLSTVKRSDFWGMAAYFSRTTVQRSGVAPNVAITIGERPQGEYALGTTSGNKTPRDPDVWADGATLVRPRYLLTGDGPRNAESYPAALARQLT